MPGLPESPGVPSRIAHHCPRRDSLQPAPVRPATPSYKTGGWADRARPSLSQLVGSSPLLESSLCPSGRIPSVHSLSGGGVKQLRVYASSNRFRHAVSRDRLPERQARLTKILKDAFDDKPKPKLVAIRTGALKRR